MKVVFVDLIWENGSVEICKMRYWFMWRDLKGFEEMKLEIMK